MVGIQKLETWSPWVNAIAYANIALITLGTLASVYVLRYQRMVALCERAIEYQKQEWYEQAERVKNFSSDQPTSSLAFRTQVDDEHEGTAKTA
jgi:hypothetical protein